MDQRVTFTRLPYADPAWHLQVGATSGTSRGAQDFYIDLNDLTDFAQRLIDFPRERYDEVRFEIGSRTGSWAYYFLLRAFLFDSVGHAALEYAADNRCTIPDCAQAKFFISCEVAALNRLGELLQAWVRHPDEPLNWDPGNG